MRKALITFGALALFSVSPALALDPVSTIGDDNDQPVLLATGGNDGRASARTLPDFAQDQTGTIGDDDDQPVLLATGDSDGTGASARMLPAFAQDQTGTIGDDDDQPASAGGARS